MSKEKTKKVVVSHPKFYMKATGGKLQHVERGTELTLAEKVARRLVEKGKVVEPGEYKRLVSTKAGLVSEGKEAEAEAIAQLSAQVESLTETNNALIAENESLKNPT